MDKTLRVINEMTRLGIIRSYAIDRGLLDRVLEKHGLSAKLMKLEREPR